MALNGGKRGTGGHCEMLISGRLSPFIRGFIVHRVFFMSQSTPLCVLYGRLEIKVDKVHAAYVFESVVS